MVLSWRPPRNDGGADILGYLIERKETHATRWMPVNRTLITDTTHTVTGLIDGYEYEFRVFAENEAGVSQCSAPSAPEKAREPVELAEFITSLYDTRATVGQNVTFECVISNENAEVKWEKDGIQFFETDRVHFVIDGDRRALVIQNVGPRDIAKYTAVCVDLRTSASLFVTAIPTLDMDSVPDVVTLKAGNVLRLIVPYTGVPTPNIAWYRYDVKVKEDRRTRIDCFDNKTTLVVKDTLRSDSGKYSVTASNSAGKITADIHVNVLDAPGAPTGPLMISDVGKYSVSLSWEPPKENGGSKVECYSVERREKFMKTWILESNAVMNTSYTVTRLNENTAYEFRVCAENMYGVGPPLEGQEPVVCKSPFTTPSIPGTPEIYQIKKDRMTLTWTEPRFDGGTPIIGYNMERHERHSLRWIKINPEIIEDTMYTVTMLTEGYEYEFRVAAVNAEGVGTPSEATSPPRVAREYIRIPSPPGIPTIREITPTTARLSWLLPISNGGSPITGYIIERRVKGSFEWTHRQHVEESHCFLNDLFEEVEYSFRVRAVNAAGESDPSRASEPVIAEDVSAGMAPVFVEELVDVPASEGSQAMFSCIVTGVPKPTIRWIRRGHDIFAGRRYHILEEEDNVYTLLIPKAGLADAGMYTVEASNRKGKAKTSAQLIIQTPPTLELDHRNREVSAKAGSTVRISVSFGGVPRPYIQWYHGDTEIIGKGRYRLEVMGNVCYLTIRDIEREDEGEYTMTVSNPQGRLSVSPKLIVQDKPGPPTGPLRCFDVAKDAMTISWEPPSDDGGSSILRYIIEMRETNKGSWLRVGTTPLLEHRVINLIEGHHYVFRVCAENIHGIGHHLEAMESVLAKRPYDKPGQPGIPTVTNITRDSVHLSWQPPVSDGGSPITGYIVEKRETTSRRWFRASRSELTDTQYNVVNLIEDSAYEFRIVAENRAGLSEPSFSSKAVLIKDLVEPIPAHFVKELETTYVVCGKVATFTAEVAGYPQPEVQWFRHGRHIQHSLKYKIEAYGNIHTLTIKDVYNEDTGDYAIRCNNKAATISSRAQLFIQVAPKVTPPARLRVPLVCVQGEMVKLRIPYSGIPTPTIAWDKDGVDLAHKDHYEINTTDNETYLTIRKVTKEDSGQYAIVASNCLGHDTGTVTLKILRYPDPPRELEVMDVSKDSVRLSWLPPVYDGGSRVSSFFVEKREVGTDTWTRCITTRNTSHTILGLKEHTEYQFRTRALNLHGESESSEVSKTIKTTPRSPERPEFEDYEYKRKFYDNQVDLDFLPYDVIRGRPGSVYDHYEICEELGRGAYGVVYRAIEKTTTKTWAAKFITVGEDERKAVKKEIEIMCQLHHKRLLQLHEVFETDEEIIMVLEFLSGGELFERLIDENYVLTEPEVVIYMRQLCDGIKYMHEKNILHLDIKPENILCATRTGYDIKLIDFGLARHMDPGEQIKVMFGTPEFVAPEVVNFEPIGLPTDMWTVGVMAYILLSGLSPFLGDDDQETLRNVSKSEWDFDEEAFDDISDEALDFIEKLLVKEKPQRMSVQEAIRHPWLKMQTDEDARRKARKLCTDKLREFHERRRPHGAGDTLLGIGRLAHMGSLQAVHKAYRGKSLYERLLYMDILDAAPRFVIPLENQSALEGHAGRFECEVSALTEPLITWYKDNRMLKIGLKYRMFYDDRHYTLVVMDTGIDDVGQYTCKAVNSYGKAHCSALLEIEYMDEAELERRGEKRVEGFRRIKMTLGERARRLRSLRGAELGLSELPPQFVKNLQDKTCGLGYIYPLSFQVHAPPVQSPCNVVWYKDGAMIRDDHPHYKFLADRKLGVFVLEIQETTLEDTGEYLANVTNIHGTTYTKCILTVDPDYVDREASTENQDLLNY
uniref:Titin-like n=1 Tax=Saccoglossus kowalevskii TaxID=10224 RepID=A0ABM0MSM0_SACKO|nr:PREDICTED: titin-like [Saccoglossus kowalevskii]